MVLLKDILSLDELEKDIQEGLINVQTHPNLPLRIFNYSHRAASADVWSRSMSLCRGLIVDNDNVVVARPFQKFWNYADPRHPETMPDNPPPFLPEMTVKQDGSLLIGFKYGGQVGVATRGSFASEQAKWASDWIRTNSPGLSWPDGCTPLWEMIAAFNQIVVSYEGWEGIIALALVNNATGEETDRATLEAWAASQGIPVTPLVNKTLETCSAEDLPNFEGYVAAWRTAGKPPLRAKLKQETYLMLHRILTGLNPKAVWEMLSAGQQDKIDALFADEKIPESFKAWLSDWATQLRAQYAEIEAEAKAVFAGKPGGTRKDDALYFQKAASELCSVLFAMLDAKDHGSIIWKQIRPRATDTFKQDE